MKRALLLAGSLWLSSAFAAELKPVAVLPPVADGKVPEGIPLAIQERANAHLLSSGKWAVMHGRAVLSMTLHQGMKLSTLNDPNDARAAAQRLGVNAFFFGTLSVAKDAWTLKLNVSHVGDPGVTSKEIKLPPHEAEAVAKAGQEIAVAIAAADGVKLELTAIPGPASDAAMRDYAACAQLVDAQPIGVENPTVLDPVQLTRAQGLCSSATKESPKFADAWATLALANAIAGSDDRALTALNTATGLWQPAPYHLPNLVLAHFWLVTRYQSAEAGETVLKEALAKEPGFLLARGYLAELYNVTGKHADAAKVWQDYIAITPNGPFIISRLGYTLARLGKTDDAAKFAQKALAFDPQSPELNLELASRWLDAGQPDKAIAVLEPIDKATPTPDVVLRLGYAQLVKGDVDAAQKTLERAYTLAKAPGEWRTRGRAKLNLAAIALKKGKKDEAQKLAREAVSEGLKPVATPETKDVLALLTPAELAGKDAKVKEASPFSLKGGEVDPSTHPKEPKGFEEQKVK
ncbi:MAG: tetratricopeptide repeat protein [Myxococcaceae bacterium]